MMGIGNIVVHVHVIVILTELVLTHNLSPAMYIVITRAAKTDVSLVITNNLFVFLDFFCCHHCHFV